MLVYRSYEENVLLQLMASGDEKAFTVIYERYREFVRDFVVKFVKLPELAEDITQEIFIKLWEGRSSLSGVQTLKGFLIVVARNHTLNILKRVAHHEAVKRQVIHQYQGLRNPVEEDLLSREYRRHLSAALQALPQQTQKVFHLCREQQKSYEEVARLLGISRSAVKKHMVRSTKTLRELLKAGLDISVPLLLLTAGYWC